VVIMLTSMSLVGWGWNWLKRRHRWLATTCRLTVFALFLYSIW
jgi:hypothetical protein